ncbi:MAG: hypothetical protein OEN50_19980 [Deltaproteobacteria bacterium]|nr:hypothetical protein [Deltaproteobacteria bacterium]
MSRWQPVFLRSKVNRGVYGGDSPAIYNWAWPQETWFQKRLRYLRTEWSAPLALETFH